MALTDRLAQIAPVPDSVSFLTSGGSDSIDTAVKLARLYHKVMGEPQRTYVLSRFRAYHGMHTAGTSVAGICGQPGRDTARCCPRPGWSAGIRTTT